MKKTLLFFAFAAFANFSFAQTSFSDDFESYAPGDMIGASSADWTTWGGGTADDAPVSDEQAASGSNSLLIASAGGSAGPADVILPFRDKYTTGTFVFEMMMYIESGAYFNFQGETTPGQEWTFQPEFTDGTVAINNSDNESVKNASYPENEWFKFRVDVNLTLNDWNVSINDESVARFSNPNNSVASLDLYPLAGHKFFIDDISFEHTPFTPMGLDLAVAGLAVPPRALNGKDYSVGAAVTNIGLDAITSFDITWTAGAASGASSVTGVNIGSLESYTVDFTDLYTADADNNELEFAISNVNGGADDDAANNSKSIQVGVVTPAPNKAIFVEEGTGTWCGWCPRGAVGMEYMAHEYPEYFVGVAVHNGSTDPMVVPAHDAGVRGFPGFSGFPGGVVERSIVTNPAAGSLESSFFDYITKAPKAVLNNNVSYDAATRTITVEVQATFNEDVSGDYRLLAIVREDNVSGTGNEWRQSNFYAGGGNGEMGGYELLPNPVPADQMVYNEVSRALLGDFNGVPNSLPSSIAAGETHSYTFSYVVPADQDPTNMGIASVVLAPDGTADNAKLTKYGEWAVSSVENVENLVGFKGIAPNPFSDVTFIDLDLPTASEVSLEIINAQGQLVSVRNYGKLTGANKLPVMGSQLPNGIYFAKIRVNDQFTTRSIVVNK